MLTLVVGGAASGKSAYAEALVLRSAAARRIYLATMSAGGEEARRRIEKHRAMRGAGKGFETVECPVDVSSVTLPPDSAVLLEDMGNLCANELFSPESSGQEAAESILRGVARLKEQCRDLVIVSNEVFTGGADYLDDTEKYLSLLSYVNRRLAETADAVCEVSCGIPMYYKGEEA